MCVPTKPKVTAWEENLHCYYDLPHHKFRPEMEMNHVFRTHFLKISLNSGASASNLDPGCFYML